MGKDTRPRISFERQRENVLQLLRDRSNDLTSGSTIKDFAEMGPHQGGGDVFTAEYIRRHFGKPKDRDDPDSEYVEVLRGVSHLLLEKRLQSLKRVSPTLWSPVNKMFPRESGAHRDYDWYRARAAQLKEKSRRLAEGEDAVGSLDEPRPPREGGRVSDAAIEAYAARRWAERSAVRDLQMRASQAERELYLCGLGIDLLTTLCREDELFVEFARARTVREETAMEEQNAEIAGEYEERKAERGYSEKDAAESVAKKWNISSSRVRQIAEGQRLARGEPKRKPGRPRKEDTA